MEDPRRELLIGFERELWKTAEAAKALKPSMPATAFRRMLVDHGGKGAADRLLQKSQPSDGFNDLYLHGKECMKLSVEYVALSEPWRQLFTAAQLAVAKKRLLDVDCELPPEALQSGKEAFTETDGNLVEQPLPEELPAGVGFAEGAVRRVEINSYERNPEARSACLAHYGSACVICGMEFGLVYGKEFSGFIHVHHLRPIASIGQEYRVDPIADLRPVCPNCHAVIHHGGKMRSLDEVKVCLAHKDHDPSR